MPNRIIKDSIRTSKAVNNMTDFQFRLWVYLITYVDDYGRGSADAELLKGFVFPRRKGITESSIDKALADLANSGLILLYEVDGEPYFCFPNWSEHQRIQTKKSKYPAPENGNSRCVTVNFRESPPESESNTNPNTNTKESAHARKAKYGEYGHVMLTEDEYAKLTEEYDSSMRDECIKFLDEYIEENPKYNKASHYLTIKRWVVDAVNEHKGNNKTATTKTGTKTATSFDVEDAVTKALKKTYKEQ